MNIHVNEIQEKQKNRFTREIEFTVKQSVKFIMASDVLFTKKELDRLGMVNIILTKDKNRHSGTVDSWESNGKINAEIHLVLTTLYDTISTLAHELIHVKQHVSGRFQPIDSNTVIWEGDKYSVQPRHFKDLINSLELPWEKEAHRYESVLVGRFFADFSGLNEVDLVDGYERLRKPVDNHEAVM